MKSKLREKSIKKRQSLCQTEINCKEKKINQNVLDSECLEKIEKICVYMSKDSEVPTRNLIKKLLEKKKKIFVPYVVGNQIKVCRVNNFQEMVIGKFNILEPKEKKEFKEKLDLIIVPGVAFDRKGNRLGRGKGYYDKFLKKIKALKVGLAFEEQIVENMPIENHDMPLDLIITDKQIIRPSSK